jgi:hypothetical protein
MFYYPVPGDDATKSEMEQYEAKKWTDSAVRRFIARVGEENVDDLFALRIADAESNPKTAFSPKEIELLQERISDVRAKDMAIKITDLRIDGNDLKELGIGEGPEMGRILKELLEQVIEDPAINDKEILTRMAQEMHTEEK